MFDEDIRDTWKRAEAGAGPLSREELERILRPSERRSRRALTNTVLVYLLLPLASSVLAATNVAYFAGNPNMVALELGLCVLGAAFAGFSLVLVLRLRRDEAARHSLTESLRRRLELYERSFGAWVLMAAATPWLLTMSINTRLDGRDGTWGVNHPFEFVLVSILTWVITYVALRVSLRTIVFEMRAALSDLLAEALEATPRVAGKRSRARLWMALLTVLLVLSVAAALWLWWSHSPGAGS